MRLIWTSLFSVLLAWNAFAAQPAGPEWARNLPIYQANVRQCTPEGTFRAFEAHLPEIKALGAGIIWIMPIHPTGADKKSFGSFYCVRDFLDIDPSYGTKEDFKHLVARAHELGLYVMMDWVPNHSSWDCALTTQHPDWYQRDAQGRIQQARKWRDVAAFDYSNRAVWRYMADAYVYWVKEFDVDGFRCDSAWSVPFEHWTWLRPELQKRCKPLLMLAENNDPRCHPAFDMTYDWNLPQIMWDIAKGAKPATALDAMLEREKKEFPAGAVRMRFTYNHDYNWSWRLKEKYGDGIKTFAVLCATLPGKPLVFNGQEVGLDRLLPASMRGPSQPIEWVNSPMRLFYTRLLTLYQQSPALYEGDFIKIASSNDAKVYAYLRKREAGKVFVILNLSGDRQQVTLANDAIAGTYKELFTDEKAKLGGQFGVDLAPWDYRVYVQTEENRF